MYFLGHVYTHSFSIFNLRNYKKLVFVVKVRKFDWRHIGNIKFPTYYVTCLTDLNIAWFLRLKVQLTRMEGNPASGTRSHTEVHNSSFFSSLQPNLSYISMFLIMARVLWLPAGYSIGGANADVTADQYHKYKVSLQDQVLINDQEHDMKLTAMNYLAFGNRKM
jgi:hypothetical protein